MNLNTILYVLGAIVVAYIALVVIVGIFRGWSSVTKIWFWTKKLGWLFLIIGGMAITLIAIRRKMKEKDTINSQLNDAKAIENKTDEDLQKIKELEKQRDSAEQDIVDITSKYKKKVDDLKSKPEQPGDAGKSYDDLKKNW
jgi:hypothetical protein